MSYNPLPPLGQAVMASSLPVVISSNQSTINVSQSGAIPAGTNAIGTVSLTPATTGGLTSYHLVSTGSTNPIVVKASAGQVFGWYIYNSSASARKVAFHNSASAPTAGAGIFYTMVIPPTSAANAFSDIGITFSTGIAITMVTGLPDNDNNAVAANDLIFDLWYK